MNTKSLTAFATTVTLLTQGSTASSSCAIRDNVASCNSASGFLDLSGYDTVSCVGDSVCQHSTIENTDNVVCQGDHACSGTAFSSIENLECSGGDYPCTGATISKVPQGGQVDCGLADENYGYACYETSITSEMAFTLTCQNALACTDFIDNPGGSVFCFGDGSCTGPQIMESVQCIIFGSFDAADGASLIAKDDDLLALPQGKVWVSKRCQDTDVVDYLNKVHPHGGATPCEDRNGNNHCDVVEVYCAEKTNDAFCVPEFQVVNGEWTKETIHSAMDQDPGSLPVEGSDDNDSDNVDKERWIVGSIVIAIVLLATIGIVVYCWKKNRQVEQDDGAKDSWRDTAQNALGQEQETEEDV